MAKPPNKPRKKANGYKMPDPLPNGQIIVDIAKKKWKLGPSIGKGGFGEIYSAQTYEDGSSKKSNSYPYVIKIEPHENGPLFVEMHFYMRNCKPDDIEAFKKEKKLSFLGIPKYLGSGSHEYNNTKYRFVVIERFGTDIWKIFLENNKCFPEDTVFKLGIQILDVLEYIHSRNYIHADIKGANILLSLHQKSPTQAYLVDFGLCSHYDNTYKPNPKKAHNGTIEYLSRDAHLGVESRRGDLEILGYNLTQWLGCVLPWEKNLSDPTVVQNSKQKYMDNLREYFKICFKDKQPPEALLEYFKYATQLKFETTPDYKKLRNILLSGVESAGGSLKTPFSFKLTTATPTKRKSSERSPALFKKSRMIQKTDESKGDKKKINKPKVESKLQDKELITGDSSPDKQDQTNLVYTAEMLRIKNKLDANKKTKKVQKAVHPKTASSNGKNEIIPKVGEPNCVRSMRAKKNVNYKEGLLNKSLNDSVDIISGSDEEVYIPKKPGRRVRKV